MILIHNLLYKILICKHIYYLMQKQQLHNQIKLKKIGF